MLYQIKNLHLNKKIIRIWLTTLRSFVGHWTSFQLRIWPRRMNYTTYNVNKYADNNNSNRHKNSGISSNPTNSANTSQIQDQVIEMDHVTGLAQRKEGTPAKKTTTFSTIFYQDLFPQTHQARYSPSDIRRRCWSSECTQW